MLALDRGKTDLLSSFELAGLTPLRAGMAQIVVTFHLDEDLVLRVTAHDRLGNQTEQIYIRDRLPTPPHDARPSRRASVGRAVCARRRAAARGAARS